MVDLISCEACGNQVSSMATACPKCGHPLLRSETQKADSVWSKYEREAASAEPATPSKAGLSIAWIVVAVLAIGGAWFAYNFASKSGGPGEQTQTAPLEVAIGDGIDFGDYTVTITDVSSAKNLHSTLMNALTGQFSWSDMGNRAGEGVIFVTVDYAVLNSSKVPLAAGERPQIQLQDHNGVILSPDLGKTTEEEATFGSGKVFSDLNPGMTEKRLAVFEVAEALYNQATWKVVVNGKALVSLAAVKSPTGEPAPSDQSAIPSEEVQPIIADDAETEEGGREAPQTTNPQVLTDGSSDTPAPSAPVGKWYEQDDLSAASGPFVSKLLQEKLSLPTIQLERLNGDELGNQSKGKFQPATQVRKLSRGYCVLKSSTGLLTSANWVISRRDRAVIKSAGSLDQLRGIPPKQSERGRYLSEDGTVLVIVQGIRQKPTGREVFDMGGTTQSLAKVTVVKSGVGQSEVSGTYICADSWEADEPAWR